MQLSSIQKNIKAPLAVKQEDPAKKSNEKAILQHNGSQHPPHNDKGAITLGGDSHSTSADFYLIFIYMLLGIGKKHSTPKAASGDTFNTNTTYVYSPSVNYTSSQLMRHLMLLVAALGMALVLILALILIVTLAVVFLYILPQLPMNNVVAGTPTTTVPLPQQPVKPCFSLETLDSLLDHSHEQTHETVSTFLARSSTQAAGKKEIHDKRNPEDGMELNPHAVDIKSCNKSNTTASNSQVAGVRAGISEGGEVKVENGSHDGRKKASKGGKVGDTSNSKILGGKEKNAHAESLHQGSFPIEHSSFESPHTCLLSQMVAPTPTNHPTPSHPHLLRNTPKIEHSHEQTHETVSTFLARSSTQAAGKKEIHDKRDILVTPNRNPEDGMDLNPHAVDIKSCNKSNTTASNSQVAGVRAGISEGGEVKVENGSHDGRKKASKGGKVGDTSNSKILGGKKNNAHAESSSPIEHSSLDPPHTRLTSQVVAPTPTNHPTLSHPHLLQKIEQQSLQEHKCHHSILFHTQVGEQRGNLPSVSTQQKYAVVLTPLNQPPELDIHGLSPQVSVPIDTPDTPMSKFNKYTQRTRDKHVPCHAPTVPSGLKTHQSTELLPTQLPQSQLNEDWLDSRTLPNSSPFSMQCPWHEVLYLSPLHPAKATSLATLAFLDCQPVFTASSPKMKVLNTGIDKHSDNISCTSMDSIEGSTGGLWQEESSKWAPCRPSGHGGRDLPKKSGTVDLKENKREEREGEEKWSLYIARCDACKSPKQTKSPQERSPQSNPQVAIDEKELAIATEKNSSYCINFYPTNQVSVSINTSSLELPQCYPPSQHISEDMEHPLKFQSQFKICYHPSWKNLCVPMPFTKHSFHPFTWIFYDNGSIPPLHLEDLYEHTLAQSPYQKQEHPLTAPQALPQPSTTNTLVRIQDVVDYSLSGLLILLCFHSCRRPIDDRADSSSVDICTTGYPHPQEYFPESTHFVEHQKTLSDCSQGKQQSSCPPNECTASSDYEQTEIETLNTDSTSFISDSAEAQVEEMLWKVPISESGDGDQTQDETEAFSDLSTCTDTSPSSDTPHTELASQPGPRKTEQSPNHSSDSSTALVSSGEEKTSSPPTIRPTMTCESLTEQCCEHLASGSDSLADSLDSEKNQTPPPDQLSSEVSTLVPPSSTPSPPQAPASLSPSPSESITQSPAHQVQSCRTESEHIELQNDTTHCDSSGSEEDTHTEDPLVDEAESSVEREGQMHSAVGDGEAASSASEEHEDTPIESAESSVEEEGQTCSNHSFDIDNSTVLTTSSSVAREKEKPFPTVVYWLMHMLTQLFFGKKQEDSHATVSSATGEVRTEGEGESNPRTQLFVQDQTDGPPVQSQMKQEDYPTTHNEDSNPMDSQCSVERPSSSSTLQPLLDHTDHNDNPAPSSVQLSHNGPGEEKSLSSPISMLTTGESQTEHEHATSSSDSSADSLGSETDQRPPPGQPSSELSTLLPPSSPPFLPQALASLPPTPSEPNAQSPTCQEKRCHTERGLQNNTTHCDSPGSEEDTDTGDTLVDEAESSEEGEGQTHSAVGDIEFEAASSASEEHTSTEGMFVESAENSVKGKEGQTHSAVGDSEAAGSESNEYTCTKDAPVDTAEGSVEGRVQTHSAVGDSETASSELEEHTHTKDTLVEAAESSVEEEDQNYSATRGGEAAQPNSSVSTQDSNTTQSHWYTDSYEPPVLNQSARKHKLLKAMSWIVFCLGAVITAILSPRPTVLHWMKRWYDSHTTVRGARDGGGRTETEEERDTRGSNSSSHHLVLEGNANDSLTSEQHHTEQDNHTSTQRGTEQDSRYSKQDHDRYSSAQDGTECGTSHSQDDYLETEHGTPHSGERRDGYHLKTEHNNPRNPVKDDHQSARDSMEHVTPHSGQNHDSCITAQDGTEDDTHHRQERQDSYQVETEQSTPQNQAMRNSHHPAEDNMGYNSRQNRDNCQESTDTSRSGHDQMEKTDHHSAQDVSEEDSPQSEQKQDYLLVHNKTEHSTSQKDVEESNCQSTQSEREQDTHHSLMEHQGGTGCTQHPQMEQDARHSEGDRGRGTHCPQTEQQDDQCTQVKEGHISPHSGHNELDLENHHSQQVMRMHSSLPSQQSSCDGHPRKFGTVEDQVSQDNQPTPPCDSPSTPAPQTVCQSPPHPPQLDTSSLPSLCDQTDPSKVNSLSRGPGPGKGSPSQTVAGLTCQVNSAMYESMNPLVHNNSSTTLTTTMNTSPVLQSSNCHEEGASYLAGAGVKETYLQDTSSGHHFEKKELSPSADNHIFPLSSGDGEPEEEEGEDKEVEEEEEEEESEVMSAEMEEQPTPVPEVHVTFSPIQDHGNGCSGGLLVSGKEDRKPSQSYGLPDTEDEEVEFGEEDEGGKISKRRLQELEEVEMWKEEGVVEGGKEEGVEEDEEDAKIDPGTTSAPVQVTYSDRHQGPLTTAGEKHQNLLADSVHEGHGKTRPRLTSSDAHKNGSPSLGVEQDQLGVELATHVPVQETYGTHNLTTPTNTHDDSVFTSEAVSKSHQTGLSIEYAVKRKSRTSTVTLDSGIGSKPNTGPLLGIEGRLPHLPQHPTPVKHSSYCSAEQLPTTNAGKEVHLEAAAQEHKTTGHPFTGQTSTAKSSSPPPVPVPGVSDDRDHSGHPGNQEVAASSPVHGSSDNEAEVEEETATPPSSSNAALAVEQTISPLGTHSNVSSKMEVQSPVQKSATSGLLVGSSFYPHDPILKKFSHGGNVHILPFDGPTQHFVTLVESSVPHELCTYIKHYHPPPPPQPLFGGPLGYNLPKPFLAMVE